MKHNEAWLIVQTNIFLSGVSFCDYGFHGLRMFPVAPEYLFEPYAWTPHSLKSVFFSTQLLQH